jgi:hypothetical protein
MATAGTSLSLAAACDALKPGRRTCAGVAAGLVLHRGRFVQQRRHARGGDHRLLQLAELHGDLDQRLDHAREVADEGVQHADLGRRHRPLAEHEDHGASRMMLNRSSAGRSSQALARSSARRAV